MSKILLVLNHPNIKESFANNIVVNKLKELIPDIELDHKMYMSMALLMEAKGIN